MKKLLALLLALLMVLGLAGCGMQEVVEEYVQNEVENFIEDSDLAEDAEALLNAIKARKVGAACLDVYEEESDLFFEDNSGHILEDDTLARLISMPNVIVTSHQAFLTEEALENIAETTVQNLITFAEKGQCANELCWRGTSAEDCRSGKCF